MTKDEQRKRRQLISLHRGTRGAKARLFLRCEPYMIAMIDSIIRDEQIAEGRPVRPNDFGLRLVYTKEV